MPTHIFRFSIIVLAAIIMSYDMPKGWIAAGNKAQDYEMGTDPGAGHNGKNAATIRSVRRKIEGFGTLMQTFAADKYKGKRLRLTGYIKAADVEDWAALWFRVDGKTMNPVTGKNVRKVLSFDNMSTRPITGTQDYTKCEIVLDVPDSATYIAYGALLDGTGQIWFDNLKFDVVTTDVPVTSSKRTEPFNMDFEQ
jgi:hypothetical protein